MDYRDTVKYVLIHIKEVLNIGIEGMRFLLLGGEKVKVEKL
jgi:hypothetical protein